VEKQLNIPRLRVCRDIFNLGGRCLEGSRGTHPANQQVRGEGGFTSAVGGENWELDSFILRLPPARGKRLTEGSYLFNRDVRAAKLLVADGLRERSFSCRAMKEKAERNSVN